MSAPYGEGQPGTVFIYSGQNGSPIPVLSQTIVGSALNLEESLLNGLTSFGAFIEGNTDIDGSSYWSLPKSQDVCAQVRLCSLAHGQVCVVCGFMSWMVSLYNIVHQNIVI